MPKASALQQSVLFVCECLRQHEELPRTATLQRIDEIQEFLVSLYESYTAPAQPLGPEVSGAMQEALALYSQSLSTLSELLNTDGNDEVALETVEMLALEAESRLGDAMEKVQDADTLYFQGLLA